ncbi:hypothetical protein AMS68_006819 [Peltaster fructicola]|uniref:COP9 signalosome complex subunit 6 n=1 Tax=Peltaster fructicola TaxID=286661 RepID=A0A6H0Y2Q6_9PEZI|nr:hypothetical protein AMS68_006819 [Peltaster fructicola]
MSSETATQNPLVSNKPAETSLTIQLHPLVLLTISDYITRHTLRRQQGPVIGAVIGQQNGRHITLEHAYECLLASASADGKYLLDPAFFEERLEQYREVHKEPQLELVAIFMLGPSAGPQPEHLPVLQQVQKLVGSDAVLLLLFHPEQVDQQDGGKLPLALYEPVTEGAQSRFLERPFDVETGEAEMIGVDFVAKGGGNASAVIDQAGSPSAESSKKAKSKGKAKDGEDGGNETAHTLSAEDEELISSLTARSNAIKMLNQRLQLIQAYLSSLPASILTDAKETAPAPPDTNFALLRSINAMLSRLPLLTPTNASEANVQQAALSGRQDVHLTSLLAALTQTVSESQGLGSRFQDVQRERASKERPVNARGAAPEMDMSRS